MHSSATAPRVNFCTGTRPIMHPDCGTSQGGGAQSGPHKSAYQDERPTSYPDYNRCSSLISSVVASSRNTQTGNTKVVSMEPSRAAQPLLKDLTIENITANVRLANSQADDARLRYVFDRLVQHLHDFARETRLSQEEWMRGIQFLTAAGQMCTEVRQVCAFQLACSVPFVYLFNTSSRN